jgi:hypothetical protein
MLLKPLVMDGAQQRLLNQGDTLAGGEILPATNANAAITITGAMLMNSLINRSPGGAGTDTIDTAANIIAAIGGGLGTTGVQNGTSWRTKWLVTTAFAVTVTAVANTGIIVNLGVVNASSAKDFLVTVVNGTPAQSFAVNTTNASAVVTGLSLAQTALLTPGMVITNAAAGLQGLTILSVQPGTGVTLSGTANTTAAGTVLNFSPTITIQGIGQGLI